MTPREKKRQTKNSALKSYKQPRLQEYGGLRNITQTAGRTGSRDGGVGAHSRTR